jgi:hypothetical protein
VRGLVRRAIAPALAVGLLVAACGTGPAPTPASPASGPPTAAATVEPSGAGPSGSSASFGPSTSPDAITDAPTRDDSLLAILPPDIDGVPVAAEEESFAEAVGDPAFAANIERAAFFVVVRDTDLASGLVAVFRDGRFTDAVYQDWRETYDEGVCEQAGGVQTNAEVTLDGRTVYITTCAGGLRIYHAYVEERQALVSLFSLGEGRYGERLVSDLREGA